MILAGLAIFTTAFLGFLVYTTIQVRKAFRIEAFDLGDEDVFADYDQRLGTMIGTAAGVVTGTPELTGVKPDLTSVLLGKQIVPANIKQFEDN